MEEIIYFIVWAGLIFLMMRFGCGAHIVGHGQQSRNGHPDGGGAAPLRWIPPETDTDPVCGKTVRTSMSKTSVYDGAVYYFCSRECRERFEAAPHTYLPARVDRTATSGEHVHG